MTAKIDGPSNAQIVRWMGGSVQTLTVATAERVLRAEVGAGRFTTSPIVITDGMVGKDYREVKAGGKIEFVARPIMVDVVRWTLETLRRLAPVGPGVNGHYRDRFVVLLNGKGLIDGNLATLARAKPGDRVQIVNIQPYARKIEGQRANRRKQWRGRRGQSRQAPGGVFRKALQMILQRWARVVFVDYRLERLSIGGLELKSSAGKLRSKGGFYTYPVLQFYLKPNAR